MTDFSDDELDEWVFLGDVPLVAELEGMIARGLGWSKEYEARCDEVSIALFGITEADTRPPPPLADVSSEQAHRATLQAAQRWHDWQLNFAILAKENQPADLLRMWRDWHIDVSDDNGRPLRCLPQLERQLLVWAEELLPDIEFTEDGSGTRRQKSVDQVEQGLLAEAQAFMARRNK